MYKYGNYELNTVRTSLDPIMQRIGQEAYGQNSTFINSAFTVEANVEGLVSGDGEVRAQSIQCLIQEALCIISKFAGGEEQVAKTETEKNKNDAKELDKNIEKTEKDLSQSFKKIKFGIDDQTDIVQNATDNIEDASNEMQEKQEKIEETIKKIQEIQEELRCSTDPKQQAKLLAQINGLSQELSGIVASVSEGQETIKDASDQVETAYNEIENLNDDAFEVQEVTTNDINKEIKDANNNTQNNTITEGKGKTNKITAEALQKIETSSSSIPVVGSTVSEKVQEAEIDQRGAGNTRSSGAEATHRSLQMSLSSISGLQGSLGEFNNVIGSAIGSFNTGIGNWNNAISPLIESVGTLTNGELTGSLEELNTAVTTDLDSIGFKLNKKGKAKVNKDALPTEKTEKPDGMENSDSEDGQVNNLLTPDVKIKFDLNFAQA